MLINLGCQAQTKSQMTNNNNPLLCDPKEGICGLPSANSAKETNIEVSTKPLKVIYFTDPICSSCWGIEPQLRKLKLEYGSDLDIEYRMGGLLPDWSYNSGGISQPSDVAHHWDEVSVYYDMPIDGDLWLEDPLHSSYPPSIAFKAAQMQDPEKAVMFLREIREMVFLKKINIAKWDNIALAANNIGLDVAQLKTDFNGDAAKLFEDDLTLAKNLGVRGFPTLFFMDSSGKKDVVYGSKPYPYFEMAVLKLNPAANKSEYSKEWKTLFDIYPSLSAREFSELSGTPRADSEKLLDGLISQNIMHKITTKNGSIWVKKNDGI